MDLATTGLLKQQTKDDAVREAAAQQGGKSSVANLLNSIEGLTTIHIAEGLRPTAENAIHYGLGIGPGVLYALLRRRIPVLQTGRGLLLGLLLFIINDEFLNTALGLSGLPEAYPPSTHLRGLVGHLVLGTTTELVIDVTGG